MKENNLYHYRGLVTSVYDGDTITVNIDLGFHVSLKKEKFRLYRINTPEVRGVEKEKGKVSRDWLRERILEKEVILVTLKDKKGKTVVGLQMYGLLVFVLMMSWLRKVLPSIKTIKK